jgi:hypothetical protein
MNHQMTTIDQKAEKSGKPHNEMQGKRKNPSALMLT